MSKYQAWLVDYVQTMPTSSGPERYRNEILGFLRDRCRISRSAAAPPAGVGIPLPFDDKYVTSLVRRAHQLCLRSRRPGDTRYETFWPHVEHLSARTSSSARGVLAVHAQGGRPAAVPRLNVHGYWRHRRRQDVEVGRQRGRGAALADKYGSDALPLLRDARDGLFGLDADFSEEALVARLNATLANDLGNLASRASTLIVNFAGGVVPAAGTPAPEEQRSAPPSSAP